MLVMAAALKPAHKVRNQRVPSCVIFFTRNWERPLYTMHTMCFGVILSDVFTDIVKWNSALHTVSFDRFLSGLEWILNLEFCLLKLLIFYQKLLWNIRSIWVFEPVFKYVWSKSSFFMHKASILIKHI